MYIEKAHLNLLIITYQQDPSDVANQEALGQALCLMATNVWLMFRAKHANYLEEDAKQYGILVALKYLPKYDEAKGNAFAYVTEAIIMGIKQHLRQERSWHDKHVCVDEMKIETACQVVAKGHVIRKHVESE